MCAVCVYLKEQSYSIMPVLRRLRKKILVAIMLLTLWSISPNIDPRLTETNTHGKKNFRPNPTSKRGENGLHAVSPATSWLDHLCPKYHLSEEPSYKLRKETSEEGNIFFIQTSCRTHFTVREACAIESASFHHPNQTVLVFMTAPAINETHPFVKVLMKMKNIKMSWLDVDEIFRDPFLEQWHEARLWLINEDHAPRFVSDAARMILLWHFGGTYLDLDMITIRPFPKVTNFLAREDEKYFNLAIASFTKRHKLLGMLLRDLPSSFDAYGKSSIGPLLLTNCLHQLCPGMLYHSTSYENIEFCEDITLFPPKYFYPLDFSNYSMERLFRTGWSYGPKFFNSTESYTLHICNGITSKYMSDIRGDTIVTEAARRNCPKIYATALKYNVNI